MNQEQIQNYLNIDGKVKIWPSKRKNKVLILEYIVKDLKSDESYTEKELDEHICKYIAFEDYVIVRRELYENKFVDRTQNGQEYWKV